MVRVSSAKRRGLKLRSEIPRERERERESNYGAADLFIHKAPPVFMNIYYTIRNGDRKK